MRAIRTLFLGWSPFVLAVALLAVAARIIVPTGFMPAADIGGVRYILCSGQALAVDIPHDTSKPSHKADGDCAFSVISDNGLSSPPLAAPLAPWTARSGLHQGWRPRAAAVTSVATRSQPATGPPNLI